MLDLMPRYRLDMHVHTRVSPDGLDLPEKVVDAAVRAGLDGIVITDHDRGDAYDRLVELGLADPSGEPVNGFLVVPGVEVSCNEGHVLVIGAAWSAPAGLLAREVALRAHEQGALCVAPHPFDRFRSGVGRTTLDEVSFDAIEVCNSKTLDMRSNTLAAEYAEKTALPGLAGSDAHEAATVGRAHTLVDAERLSVRAVVNAVAAGEVEVVHGLHTRGEIARYLARGWVTRPWLVDWASRMCGRAARAIFTGGSSPALDQWRRRPAQDEASSVGPALDRRTRAGSAIAPLGAERSAPARSSARYAARD